MRNTTLSLMFHDNFALKVGSANSTYLWHLCYGHVHSEGLRLLKEKNMVIGLPTINKNSHVCKGCICGKMHKLPFPKTSLRAKAPLKLVHSDICGPMKTPTPRNKRYFILFVDDYTRMMWIYFLNQKSEAFSTFLQFIALVERETGFLMKILRIDRGGDFLYNPFIDYCKINGIKRQLTISRIPQQDGVAKEKIAQLWRWQEAC